MPLKVTRRMRVMCPDGRERSLGVYSEDKGIRGRMTLRRKGEQFDITGTVENGLFRPFKKAMHIRKVQDWVEGESNVAENR